MDMKSSEANKSSGPSKSNNVGRPVDRGPGGELTIGELARSFGTATHVLRHWESAGVLEPARRTGGQRRYTDDQRCQVALILRAQRAEMSLARIREALDAPDQQTLRALLSAHLDELAQRMDQLREAMEVLEHSMACQPPDVLDCPRAQELLENTTAACTGDAVRVGDTVHERDPAHAEGTAPATRGAVPADQLRLPHRVRAHGDPRPVRRVPRRRDREDPGDHASVAHGGRGLEQPLQNRRTETP